MDIEKEIALTMYKTMVTIRLFEEKAIELFRSGYIPGWLHSYIGEEAIATGVCLALNKDDYISSNHRGHGHCIAKGANLQKMMAELFAKKTGYCKGKGGSMHIFDSTIGILGANGIVGGGIPIATGAGLSSQYLKNKRVSVAFFGDGASDQGSFHESINLASAWKLPVIYVCENNLYAQAGCQKEHQNIKDIAERAKGYGIPGVIADGMDVIDVYNKAKISIERARKLEGPTLIEAKTYRYKGHYDGDPELYRSVEEKKCWMQKDPIKRHEEFIISNNIATLTDLELIKNEVKTEIEKSINFANSSEFPDDEDALEDLFV